MADALWINEQTLIDNSVVIDSVDFKTITPNIIWVQDVYIQRILGTDLFNQINAMIIAGTLTTASNPTYKTLMDSWITKVLVNYILAESAPDMVYRWTNKGIMTKTAENSQSVTIEQLASITARYKYRAESYAKRLISYLIQENTTYPNYNANTDYSDLFPTTSSVSTGIWMPNDDEDNCFNNLHNRQTRS